MCSGPEDVLSFSVSTRNALFSTSEGEAALEGKQTPAPVRLFGKPHSFLLLSVTKYG